MQYIIHITLYVYCIYYYNQSLYNILYKYDVIIRTPLSLEHIRYVIRKKMHDMKMINIIARILIRIENVIRH